MLLDKIKGPEDLKKLSVKELPQVAEEIREGLFNRLTKKGGHFGPNFGIVELTIALHYVFDSPRDKFVFDVSHQCYPHKMLTGRAEGFFDDKKFSTVSGYTDINESEHDPFTVGHTSTSISLASGLAKGRDLAGGKENVIAIIGDGSLSGGEALEGLDFAGEMKTNLIIVVNDNEQSIAEVHGGLYKGLNELRATKGKSENNLFKAMGLDYVYEENGNDIASLVETFKKVKDIDHPIVVHVHTQKGKGYALAEENRERWHWTMPFDKETGEPKGKFSGETYQSLTAEYLLKKMEEDKSVVFVTAAVPGNLGFDIETRKKAKDQYIDVGIAEEHAIGLCSGIAQRGGNPVFGTNSTFIQRTYDQLSQDICLNKSPVTILLNGSSMNTLRDATHLGIYALSMMVNIPNLVYLCPTDKKEYFAMLDWSLKQREWPVAISVPCGKVGDHQYKASRDYSKINTFQMSEKGMDIALIALGDSFADGMKVAEILEERLGHKVTLINPRFASGIDEKMLESLKEDHCIVATIEDGNLEGGFGAKVAQYYSETNMMVKCFGLKKSFYDRYDPIELKRSQNLLPEQIVDEILKLFVKFFNNYSRFGERV